MKRYIAHRGLKINSYKENTMDAFKASLENINYAGFECDIRTTKDHVFVVVHNPIIKDKIISQTNYKELKEKYHIPTLEEVLSLKSDKIFLLEIKENNIDIDKFLKILEKYPLKNIYVMSFFNSVIKKLNQNKKTYKLGVLNYVLNSEEDYSHYDFICLLENIATLKLVHFFENKKIQVFFYGIHHLENLEKNYPKAYFITDEIF